MESSVHTTSKKHRTPGLLGRMLTRKATKWKTRRSSAEQTETIASKPAMESVRGSITKRSSTPEFPHMPTRIPPPPVVLRSLQVDQWLNGPSEVSALISLPSPTRTPPSLPSEISLSTLRLDEGIYIPTSAVPPEITKCSKPLPFPPKPVELHGPEIVSVHPFQAPRIKSTGIGTHKPRKDDALGNETDSQDIADLNAGFLSDLEWRRTKTLRAEVTTVLNNLQELQLEQDEIKLLNRLESERLVWFTRLTREQEYYENQERARERREREELRRKERVRQEEMVRSREQRENRLTEYENWIKQQRELERQELLTIAERKRSEALEKQRLERERLVREEVIKQQILAQLMADLERQRKEALAKQKRGEEERKRQRKELVRKKEQEQWKAALQRVGVTITVSQVSSLGSLTTKLDLRDLTPAILKQMIIIKKHFLSRLPTYKIIKIEYVMNDTLYNQFNNTKSEFRRTGRNTKEWLVFHGTNANNVDRFLCHKEMVLTYSILTGGFRVGGVNGHAAVNGQAWVRSSCCTALVILGSWNILHELR